MQPEEIEALLDRANELLEAGKPDESLACLDQVADRILDADNRIEWGSLRAWALTEMGRDREAIEMLDDLLEEYPQSSRLLGTLGVVLSNSEQLEDARDALEDAVLSAPHDEVAVANLALVYEKLREYRRAAELYERSLELGADIDWVLQRQASVLTELGRYAAAKSALKRYLSLVPDDAAQWIALGILHSDDEEFDQAQACYAQAEQVDPELPALRLNWGVTAVRAGDLKTAYSQLSQLQQIEPRSTRWWLLRAFILEEEDELAAAREIYDRILRRTRFTERNEMTYALEMAMDFFARHKQRPRCVRLMERAYRANACTVELCEAYREATGHYVDNGFWFSLMLEADYRKGLSEIREAPADGTQRFTRFVRDFQVVARDHDEAIGLVMDLARRMGESNPTVREFLAQEPIENTHTGIYEVEADSYVFDDNPAD